VWNPLYPKKHFTKRVPQYQSNICKESVITFEEKPRVTNQEGNHMKQMKVIRIRKRAQLVAGEQASPGAIEVTGQKAEQKMRKIVAGWVRDHRQRSEDLQRNLAAAFRKGLPLPSLAD
jgi:hypothetical protein